MGFMMVTGELSHDHLVRARLRPGLLGPADHLVDAMKRKSKYKLSPERTQEAALFITYGLSYAKTAKLFKVETAWLWYHLRDLLGDPSIRPA